MNPEENKALVRRLAINKGNLEELEDLLAQDFVSHDPSTGATADREGYKQALAMLVTAFPDLSVEIEEMVAEGDRVAVRAMERGTHRGPLMGISPTNRPVTIPVSVFFRVANGKIVERWALADIQGLLRQIGADMPGELSPSRT